MLFVPDFVVACSSAPATETEGRIVITSGDFELLKRIEIRIDDGDAENGAVVLRAIQEKPVRSELLSVDVDLVAAL